MRSTQLPTLFPSYDERASQPFSTLDVPSVDIVSSRTNVAQGRNVWNERDRRPTKEEAQEKLEDFNILVEVLDYVIPKEVSNNIPYWIRGPFGIAPEVAEFLVEVDPLDRLQD